MAKPRTTPPRGAALVGELATLLSLAAVGVALVVLTPRLVVPFKPEVPWYESAATFPRVALALVVLGALVEALRRLRSTHRVASDELDSGAAQWPRVVAALVLFVGYALAVPIIGFGVSSALFIAGTARAVGLSWRAALALALALPLALLLWLVFVVALKVAFGRGWLF